MSPRRGYTFEYTRRNEFMYIYIYTCIFAAHSSYRKSKEINKRKIPAGAEALINPAPEKGRLLIRAKGPGSVPTKV